MFFEICHFKFCRPLPASGCGLTFLDGDSHLEFPFLKKNLTLLFSTFLLTLLDWTILSYCSLFFQAVSVRGAVSATSCTWSPFRASFVANCTAASVEDAGKFSCHLNVKLWSWPFDFFWSNSRDRGAARPKSRERKRSRSRDRSDRPDRPDRRGDRSGRYWFSFIELRLLSFNQSLIHCVYRRMTKYSCQFPWLTSCLVLLTRGITNSKLLWIF